MPREDLASPLSSPLPRLFFLPLSEQQGEQSRFRVDPFHFNNLHVPRRPLRGAEFRSGSDRLSTAWKRRALSLDCRRAHPQGAVSKDGDEHA